MHSNRKKLVQLLITNFEVLSKKVGTSSMLSKLRRRLLKYHPVVTSD